jgi:hypothetical protein
MIINKSGGFQLPSSKQMQKNIFRVQKNQADRRKRLCCFLELLQKYSSLSCRCVVRRIKSDSSLEEPPGFIMKILFSGRLWQ